jgi:RNA polymerase-interacting CarD/CdnL/TRCF family regulator
MNYAVGDQVVHWSFGLGEIVQVDEKVLSGKSNQYYVVQMNNLTIWVPVSEKGERSLRSLTAAGDFQKTIRLLAGPGEPLPVDRFQRKTYLAEMMQDGTLESLCRLVRDLTFFKRLKKVNDTDNTILDRARKMLVNEWGVTLAVPTIQAERAMNELLAEG